MKVQNDIQKVIDHYPVKDRKKIQSALTRYDRLIQKGLIQKKTFEIDIHSSGRSIQTTARTTFLYQA